MTLDSLDSTLICDSDLEAITHDARRVGASESVSLSDPDTVVLARPIHSDYEKVEKVLEGDTDVFTQLYNEINPTLLRILASKGANFHKAKEITAAIWEECVKGQPWKERNLLEMYSGQAPLKSYLAKAALNRYLSFLSSAAVVKNVNLGNTESSHMEKFEQLSGDVKQSIRDDALSRILQDALQAAFRASPPDGLLMWRLCSQYQIRQKELAPIWGCDEATISRRMDKTMNSIRSTLLKELQRSEPGLKLDWDDVLELCQASAGFAF